MPLPELVDDPNIDNDEILWRRIRRDDISHGQNTEIFKISTGAIRTPHMSVHIASLTTEDAVLSNYPNFSLVAFTAGFARSINCIVIHDPTPDDPSHTLVCAKNSSTRLSKSQAKEIINNLTFIRLPSF